MNPQGSLSHIYNSASPITSVENGHCSRGLFMHVCDFMRFAKIKSDIPGYHSAVHLGYWASFLQLHKTESKPDLWEKNVIQYNAHFAKISSGCHVGTQCSVPCGTFRYISQLSHRHVQPRSTSCSSSYALLHAMRLAHRCVCSLEWDTHPVFVHDINERDVAVRWRATRGMENRDAVDTDGVKPLCSKANKLWLQPNHDMNPNKYPAFYSVWTTYWEHTLFGGYSATIR